MKAETNTNMDNHGTFRMSKPAYHTKMDRHTCLHTVLQTNTYLNCIHVSRDMLSRILILGKGTVEMSATKLSTLS